MNTAREILDERLAKGEISIIEHAELAARLGGGNNSTPPQQPAPAPASTSKTAETIGAWIGVAIVIFGTFAYANWKKDSDLQVAFQDCLGNGVPATTCQCVVNEAKKVVNVLWYLPIVGKMIEPNEAASQQMMMPLISKCA